MAQAESIPCFRLESIRQSQEARAIEAALNKVLTQDI
jgi:hypothetical protein